MTSDPTSALESFVNVYALDKSTYIGPTLVLYFALGTFKVIENGVTSWIIDDNLMFIIVTLALSSTVLAFDLDK